MSGIRRATTLRLEEGEATWLAWSSATDQAGEQSRGDETDSEETELEDHGESRNSVSNADVDIAEFTPLAAHEVPPIVEGSVKQQAEDYHAPGFPPRTEPSSPRAVSINPPGETRELVPCRSQFFENPNDDDANNFEPVGDLPSLPKLNFKPIILREWTLISIAIFYLGLVAALGVLYYYENSARIFHVRATASRFTIRFLPSLIGTLSTLIYQSVVVNFARITPYIIMARPIHSEDICATARQTLLAEYFPIRNITKVFQNRHFGLLILMSVQTVLIPFITPTKSTLIQKKPSDLNPDLWTISISGGSAKYLLFSYSILFFLIIGLLVYLWNRRTGLKWDPVSLADHLTLLQGSDILEDFSGLEYRQQPHGDRLFNPKDKFSGVETERYRLGYWRQRLTNQYWHGIRKWSASNGRSLGRDAQDTGPETASGLSQEPSICSPIPASSHEPPHDNTLSEASRTVLRSTGARQYRIAHGIPDITDHSPEALAWWRSRSNRVLKKPNECYRYVYTWISDYFATLTYVVVAGFAAFGIRVILTGRITTGFTFPSTDYDFSVFVLVFLPTFCFGLMNNYWYQLDIWYRQLQPYMGLRQPSPASENLLLGYPCDLPVLITLRALGAGHWRLAFISMMPLVQRALQILAGSLLTVDTTTSNQYFHINVAATSFNAAVGMLCTYLILIPVFWPGLDRRLPILPLRIADSIALFYESTLVRKDAFLPRRMNEQRWHMEYRLCLDERLYGFGIYPGRSKALHLGIDDVYGYHEDAKGLRFVTPLKPPMRLYRRWLIKAGVWSAKMLHIKRHPTLDKEESEAMQRLQIELLETVKEQTPPSREAHVGTAQEEQVSSIGQGQADTAEEEQASTIR